MSLRRFNRPIKSRAAKGKSRAINRHIIVRTNAIGQKYEFHFTKGYRRSL